MWVKLPLKRYKNFLSFFSSSTSLYKWHDSHFTKEHEQETFVVDEMFFFNSDQDPLVMIVSHGNRLNTKTKANVYHVASDGKLDLLQYIFFGMDVVHKFTLKNGHYILACYSKSKHLLFLLFW